MRWLTIHLWVVTYLSCLFISGCSVKQGAHFSIAPELDQSKIEAISKSASLRNHSHKNKTSDVAKADHFRVTGFNKRAENHQRHQNASEKTEPILEFDEFEDFHSIELAEREFNPQTESQMELEIPLVAQKPVLSDLTPTETPEILSESEVIFNTNINYETEEKKTELPKSKSPQLVELGLTPLSQLTINIKQPAGELPQNTAAEHLDKIPARQVVMGESRNWAVTTKEWEAPGLVYNPLYFEEPYLERYGYNYGALQPFISAGRFFGRIPALPYMIGAYPIHECRYPLGYARPGDCPPYQVEKLPFSPRGALFESLTVTGLVFLIP
ncbi:hypothetical protein [Gimesia aquarii]|uniref:Uncharacterized protein n=1 Tax=Gimesia aquarii TaxID=2527964 RepID=A0A517VWK1_9PLAN|nr:hypothetical protein [Gimesia aquarii]QDT97381.1 hypothetical protein V144x_28560 [Gimesia aquarii]